MSGADELKLGVLAMAFGLQALGLAVIQIGRNGRDRPRELVWRGDSLVASERAWRPALGAVGMAFFAGASALLGFNPTSTVSRPFAALGTGLFGVVTLCSVVVAFRPWQVRIGPRGVTVRAIWGKRTVAWPLIEADLGALTRAGLCGLGPGEPRRRLSPTLVHLSRLAVPPPVVYAAIVHNRDHPAERVSLPNGRPPAPAPTYGLPPAPTQYIPSVSR
jgi:hypothetical protein